MYRLHIANHDRVNTTLHIILPSSVLSSVAILPEELGERFHPSQDPIGRVG